MHALHIHQKYSTGFEQWYFLTSDIHWDSPECQLDLLKSHLELARERNALWIDNGDLLDVIASEGDRRGGKSSARPEHNNSTYLDAIVDTAVEWLAPYASMWVYAGRGNHDAKMMRMHNTDILRRVVHSLNDKSANIHLGGYGGWIRFVFEHSSGGRMKTYCMKLFHGAGGGGEVTKGTMEAQRMAATVANADIVVTGHVHESWVLEMVQEALDNRGRVHFRHRQHCKLASYKLDYRLDGEPTWHMQRPGGTPKPIGGKFLRFFCDAAADRVLCEIVPAPVNYGALV